MKKQIITQAIVAWGGLSFIGLVTEPSGEDAATVMNAFICKGLFFASLIACFFTARYFAKKGELAEVEE